MRRKTLFLVTTVIVLCSFVFAGRGFCYRVPTEESNIKYFYVFGADGKKTYGALRNEPQTIFVRVPDSYKGNIEIAVYDPDTSNSIDEKSGNWNTETKFSIIGGNKAYTSRAELNEEYIINDKAEPCAVDCYIGSLLAAKTFGTDKEYDKEYYHFKPIDAEKGESSGGYRYLKIVVEGISGDDNNLFAFDISPDIAEAFTFAPAIRLVETRG